MSITIDDQAFDNPQGFSTVGQVLSHIKSKNRLVVQVMIDGKIPDLQRIDSLRSQTLQDKVVFIETSAPSQIADEVLTLIDQLLNDADSMRVQAVDHLQAGEHADALRKLAACFTAWSHSQESIEKVSQLLKIDLDQINVQNGSLQHWLVEFSKQLVDIRSALDARDFSLLGDILHYEAHETNSRFREALKAIGTHVVQS